MVKTNIRMRVTPKQSKQVQEICFANGIFWITSNNILQDYEFIYLEDKYLYRFTSSPLFKGSDLEEVDASVFIRTQGTCVEETLEQELKQNNNKEETMEKNEVKSYKDVKDYLVAKGLYDRVMEIEWDDLVTPTDFSDLFIWRETIEGYDYWDEIDDTLIGLNINKDTESLVQDYKAKQGKEFIQYLETQPKEVMEQTPEQPTEAKPKQYLVFVPTKGKPKHIHQSLESAQEEAKRLCKSGLCEVMVLEVVSKYQAKVIVEEV